MAHAHVNGKIVNSKINHSSETDFTAASTCDASRRAEACSHFFGGIKNLFNIHFGVRAPATTYIGISAINLAFKSCGALGAFSCGQTDGRTMNPLGALSPCGGVSHARLQLNRFLTAQKSGCALKRAARHQMY